MLAHHVAISQYPRLWMVNKMNKTDTFTLTFKERNTQGSSISCSPYSYATLTQLIQDISRTTIPETSCLYSMYAQLIYGVNTTMYVDHEKHGHTVQPENYAEFFLTFRNSRKCPPNECIRNIAYGKCRDEYLVKKFASVLFPLFYNKQKVK